MAKVRNYTFTINNWTEEHVDTLSKIECKYIIYGKEVGESGTPHLQGTIVFKNAVAETSVRKKIPGHIEKCIALHSSLEYCKKEGDYTERGDPPLTNTEKGTGEQQRWKQYREAAEQGDFENIPEKIRFNNPRLLQYHRDEHSKKRKLDDTEEVHLWYYGKSGTGKSRKAREENPDAYLKNCNKWWCGYTDEETVLIEDFDKRHECLSYHLKIWADRYPFLGEYKGGATRIRPAKIIVTSNYHPRDIWTEETDLGPVLRRFKIVEFPQTPFGCETVGPYGTEGIFNSGQK